MAEHSERIWKCKVGGVVGPLPNGADFPMRKAVAAAFEKLSGQSPDFIFSGWAASLTESERAAHEDRKPSERHHQSWEILRALAVDLKQRDGEQWAAGDMLEGLLGIKKAAALEQAAEEAGQ